MAAPAQAVPGWSTPGQWKVFVPAHGRVWSWRSPKGPFHPKPLWGLCCAPQQAGPSRAPLSWGWILAVSKEPRVSVWQLWGWGVQTQERNHTPAGRFGRPAAPGWHSNHWHCCRKSPVGLVSLLCLPGCQWRALGSGQSILPSPGSSAAATFPLQEAFLGFSDAQQRSQGSSCPSEHTILCCSPRP